MVNGYDYALFFCFSIFYIVFMILNNKYFVLEYLFSIKAFFLKLLNAWSLWEM